MQLTQCTYSLYGQSITLLRVAPGTVEVRCGKRSLPLPIDSGCDAWQWAEHVCGWFTAQPGSDEVAAVARELYRVAWG